MALVDQFHRVETGVGGEVVATVVPVVAFWANSKEVADGGMVGDLLAVDLSSIGKGGLESLSENGIELDYPTITGLTNMEI